MRKQRDGEDTRQRVLAAATELFAEGGFAGTSLGAISKSCGISDGLILHHFQTKQGLYRQVLEDMAGRYARVLVQARLSAATPAEGMQTTLAAPSISGSTIPPTSAFRNGLRWRGAPSYLSGKPA